MPKTKRDILKTQLNYSATNLDRSIDYLTLVYQPFAEQHPEIAEGFEIAIALLAQAAEVIDQIYIRAWDHLPPNWKKALVRDQGTDNEDDS